MPGLHLLTLPAAYVLASMTTAECPVPGAIEVETQLVNKEAPYVTSMTAVGMNNAFRNDTDTTLSTDKWIIDGLTKSNMQSQYSFSFQTITNTRTGAVCFALNKVTYNIIYSPVIYIASDFQDMACRHAVVLTHEKHHVEEDVRTITDYIPSMRRAIENAAEAIGPQGPFPPEELEKAKQHVGDLLMAGVKASWEELLATRRKRQAAIDTEANYRRESSMCPGQFPKFDGSQ